MPNNGHFLHLLDRLNQIGVSLSREKDLGRLLETILLAAKELANADAGTLYLVEDGMLRFEILRTDSLGIASGGTSGKAPTFTPIPLCLKDGSPNDDMVVACAVINDRTINIDDAYDIGAYDFSGTRLFDEKTGYRSKSFLTVPMKNHENEVIGVLQLINALDDDGNIVPFSAASQQLVASLASQAAIALTNRQLIEQLEKLFESLIQLINTAIDDKSPYTGGHCERVPELTMMLAEAVDAADYGPFKDFCMDAADRYELKIAGLLHDCGKITTPVHVVDKASKLQTLFDRIELIDTRFEVLQRDLEIALLRRQIDEAGYQQQQQQLVSDRQFLRQANLGGEFMSAQDVARVRQIAAYRWRNPVGETCSFLSQEEADNLCIARGTLNEQERAIINHHIDVTIQMLEALPWPRHLQHVPEYAGGHHERMDGKGYPRHLTREQMSVPARVMAIADIFEALTASDRPYKPGKTLSEALAILRRMKQDQHIDPDLFDIFEREKVYLRYAERFLDPSQNDLDSNPA